MEHRSTMRMYAQEESPIRHNLFGAANSTHQKRITTSVLPLQIAPGGVEMNVEDFVPKSYGKYGISSLATACPESPGSTKKECPSTVNPIVDDVQHEERPGLSMHEKPQDIVPTAAEPHPASSRSDVLGRRVRKFFDGFGWYDGKVASRWESLEYGEQFHVVYNDGDSEDLTLAALLPLLQPVSPVKHESPMRQPKPNALHTPQSHQPVHPQQPPIVNATIDRVDIFSKSTPIPAFTAFDTKPSREPIRRRNLAPPSLERPHKYARVDAAMPQMPPLPSPQPHGTNDASSRPRMTRPYRPPEVLDLTLSDEEVPCRTIQQPANHAQHRYQLPSNPSAPPLQHHTRQQYTPDVRRQQAEPESSWPQLAPIVFRSRQSSPSVAATHPATPQHHQDHPQHHQGPPQQRQDHPQQRQDHPHQRLDHPQTQRRLTMLRLSRPRHDNPQWESQRIHELSRHRKMPSMPSVLHAHDTPRRDYPPEQHTPQPHHPHQPRPRHPSRPLVTDRPPPEFVRRKTSEDLPAWHEPPPRYVNGHRLAPHHHRRPAQVESPLPQRQEVLHSDRRSYQDSQHQQFPDRQPLGLPAPALPNLLARLPSMMPRRPPQDIAPLAAFNDMLLEAIQRASDIVPFGRKFVKVLGNDPKFDQLMDVTRLGVKCVQRRYRMLQVFMEDAMRISGTVVHMFPGDRGLHTEAERFVTALAGVIREMKPPLRALEVQLT